MHVPAWPVLPDQTLAPSTISSAFRVPSMAGLGAMICDDAGCYDDGTGGSSQVEYPTVTYPTVPSPTFEPTPFDPSLYLYLPPTATGGTVSVPQTGGGTVTLQNKGTQASPVWSQVTQGLIDITKLVTIQPGTVQQGSTTLRQNPGYAVPTPATSTAVSASVSSGAGLVIAAAVGLAALIFLTGRK